MVWWTLLASLSLSLCSPDVVLSHGLGSWLAFVPQPREHPPLCNSQQLEAGERTEKMQTRQAGTAAGKPALTRAQCVPRGR